MQVISLNAQYILYIILGVVFASIYFILKGRQDDDKSLIDLDDLVLEDTPGPDGLRHISKAAIVFFGAFILTTWMMIYMTTKGAMTEGYFTAYIAAWVTPVVMKIVFNKKTVPKKAAPKAVEQQQTPAPVVTNSTTVAVADGGTATVTTGTGVATKPVDPNTQQQTPLINPAIMPGAQQQNPVISGEGQVGDGTEDKN